jgi:HAD superfamily hydrolase (TIGR01484 family)
MKPLTQIPVTTCRALKFVLTDIDDTLTLNGALRAIALDAMERLQASGRRVVAITGRPAGWCDHIARMWPLNGVVGENGAFYFHYQRDQRKMVRRYWKPLRKREQDRRRLNRLRDDILARVPGCRVASDQAYREADLAIDFCEDVPPLPPQAVKAIVKCFEAAGAKAKVSSIHVNGWYGDYDKLSMTRILFKEIFGLALDDVKPQVVFIGDSPNDAPMFAYFPHSVGVANVKRFIQDIEARPAWVTQGEGSIGFAEMAAMLIEG